MLKITTAAAAVALAVGFTPLTASAAGDSGSAGAGAGATAGGNAGAGAGTGATADSGGAQSSVGAGSGTAAVGGDSATNERLYGNYDADSDNIFSEEEYTAMGGTFSDWDADQSGTIDRDEWRTFEEEGWGGGTDQSAGLFDEWDTNRDTLLSEDEFGNQEAFTGWDEDQSGALEGEQEEGWF